MIENATIESIRKLRPIPEQGKRYLSVNVAIVPLDEIVKAAAQLGFTISLVQIPYKNGTEIHVLLWEGAIADAPADIDDRVDRLADMVNTQAIRSCRGGWATVALSSQ